MTAASFRGISGAPVERVTGQKLDINWTNVQSLSKVCQRFVQSLSMSKFCLNFVIKWTKLGQMSNKLYNICPMFVKNFATCPIFLILDKSWTLSISISQVQLLGNVQNLSKLCQCPKFWPIFVNVQCLSNPCPISPGLY